MTVAGFLENQAGVGRGLSVGPSTGMGDTIGAAFDFTWKAHTTAAAIQYQGQPLNERNDLIKQRFGQDIHDITGTRKKYTNPSFEGRIAMAKEANEGIDDFILKGRATDPDRFKDISTSGEIRENARKLVNASEAHMNEIMVRNPSALSRTIGGFVGAAGATLLDPVNLATLPFGAGEVQAGLKGFAAMRGILKAAAIDGTINAGVEAMSQPAIMAWQQELGRRYGFGEAAENVAMAFVGGAGLSGAIRGGARGIKGASNWLGSVSMDVLDRVASSDTVPMSVRQAAAFLSRQAHIDESAPPGLIKTGEDLKAHRDQTQRMVDEFENYKPTTLASSAESRDPLNMTSATVEPGRQDLPSQTSDTAPPSSFSRNRATTPPSKRTGDVSTSGKSDLDINTSTGKIYHRVDNPATIKRLAKELAPELEGFLKDIVQDVQDARVYGVRVKEPDSLKAKAKRGRKAQQISDYVGGRIVVDSPEAMDMVMRKLYDAGDVIDVDNFLDGTKSSGYRAVHYQVMSDKGVSVEIQIQPKEIRDVQDEAHVIYKKWQNVGADATAEELAAMTRDRDAAKTMFDNAWAEWEARTGKAGEAMIDMMPTERIKVPELPEGMDPTVSADRVARAEADMKALVDELGDETFALDDGRTVSFKEFAEEVQGKKNLIEAMKTCRVA